MPNASLIKKASVSIFAVLCAYAGTCPAEEAAVGHFTAEISRINYQNNDEYLGEITIEHRLIETVILKDYRVSLFAQSEALGQWIELGRPIASVLKGSTGITMSGEGKWKTTEIIAIPLTLPHLYKNHDGDVNVMFRYKLIFTPGDSSEELENEGESVYWVTPKTDRWVLREGM